jgi:hypothetical protein
MKKIIILGVICFFVGMGFQPVLAVNQKTSYNSSIIVSGNDNQKNALVNIPVQIHKYGKIETHNLMITEEQRVKLDIFSDIFKKELDEAETLEETIAIYNNAIVSLDEIGLIPEGLSARELQRLITGNVQLEKFRNIMQTNKYRGKSDEYSNSNCLLSGSSSWTNHVWFHWAPIWIGAIYYGQQCYEYGYFNVAWG